MIYNKAKTAIPAPARPAKAVALGAAFFVVVVVAPALEAPEAAVDIPLAIAELADARAPEAPEATELEIDAALELREELAEARADDTEAPMEDTTDD